MPKYTSVGLTFTVGYEATDPSINNDIDKAELSSTSPATTCVLGAPAIIGVT